MLSVDVENFKEINRFVKVGAVPEFLMQVIQLFQNKLRPKVIINFSLQFQMYLGKKKYLNN